LLLILPIYSFTFWALVEWIGGRQGWGVVAGIVGASVSTIMAISPKEFLADPEIGGVFAEEHPVIARSICVMGVLVCLLFAIASAFGRQLGLFKD
jgi:hypothetical protein